MAAASLTHLARQLRGDVVGAQVLAPGPNHTPRDRSLSVRFSASAADGFVVYSHAGDDPLACRDHVRARLGMAQWQPGRDGADSAPASPPSRPAAIDGPREPDDKAKIERAVAIWREAEHPANTVVQHYLAGRGLDLPWQVAGAAIRYHAACPWHDPEAGRTIRVPAMVAAMRCIRTERILGIHRTRLTPDGRKVGRRMLGVARGAAVMLCPMSAVGAGLTLGEGIETCLAAWAYAWSNVWAACSVGAIERWPLLPGLQSLVLLAETDATGANARAVDAAGQRYLADGREVLVVEPQCAGDINDALKGAA